MRVDLQPQNKNTIRIKVPCFCILFLILKMGRKPLSGTSPKD